MHSHYYSVHYMLLHEVVEVRASASIVEIFHRGQRVGAHPRSDFRGHHTTDPPTCPRRTSATLQLAPRDVPAASQLGLHLPVGYSIIMTASSGV
jgi:hypothetical protein